MLLILLTLMTASGGCYNLVEINDAVVAQNFSVDLLENGELIFFAQTIEPVPRTETGETQPSRSLSFMGTGATAAEAARNIFLHFPRTFLWIHANSIFIGEKLAREDLFYISDFLLRNRNTRLQAHLFVTRDASVEEVLDTMNRNSFGSASIRSLVQQIEIQAEDLGYYSPVQVLQLMEQLLTPGIEPVLPQLIISRESGKERVKLGGMAVIKHNKVVGSLDQEESQGYHYLQGRRNQGGLIFIETRKTAGAAVTMEVKEYRCKTRPVIQGDNIIMKIDMECEFRYLEDKGGADLYRPENKEYLEGIAAEQIRKQMLACIGQAQALNSDILGWGLNIARYRPALWEEIQDEWDERFPTAESIIEVKCTLGNDGLSRKSFSFK